MRTRAARRIGDGRDLIQLRDRQLFRATHSTAQKYAEDIWDIPPATYHRLIKAAKILEDLLSQVRPDETGLHEILERHNDEHALTTLRTNVVRDSRLAVYRVAARNFHPRPPVAADITSAIREIGMLAPPSPETIKVRRIEMGTAAAWDVHEVLNSATEMSAAEAQKFARKLRGCLRMLGHRKPNTKKSKSSATPA